MGRPVFADRECGMKWRVVLELVGADGTVRIHEVSGAPVVAEYAPRMIGLTLAEGKQMLWRRCNAILFGPRRRIIAAAGDAVSGVERSGPSRISGFVGWCRCSVRWKCARPALPRVVVR
jgi:hypothetical protein